MPDQFDVWMSHGDSITQLPVDFVVTAKTSSTAFACVQNQDQSIYGTEESEYCILQALTMIVQGLQFHPEISHTKLGTKILVNFAKQCGMKPDWTMVANKDLTDIEIQYSIHATAGCICRY